MGYERGRFIVLNVSQLLGEGVASTALYLRLGNRPGDSGDDARGRISSLLSAGLHAQDGKCRS